MAVKFLILFFAVNLTGNFPESIYTQADDSQSDVEFFQNW